MCLQYRRMCVCLAEWREGNCESTDRVFMAWARLSACLGRLPVWSKHQNSPSQFLRDLWATFENQYFCFEARNIGFWTSLTCTALEALTIIAINSHITIHRKKWMHSYNFLWFISSKNGSCIDRGRALSLWTWNYITNTILAQYHFGHKMSKIHQTLMTWRKIV